MRRTGHFNVRVSDPCSISSSSSVLVTERKVKMKGQLAPGWARFKKVGKLTLGDDLLRRPVSSALHSLDQVGGREGANEADLEEVGELTIKRRST